MIVLTHQIDIADAEEVIPRAIRVTVSVPQGDMPPTFAMQQYTFSLQENATTGTEIGTLDVTDEGRELQLIMHI